MYTADKLARELDGIMYSSWNALVDFERAAEQSDLVIVYAVSVLGVLNGRSHIYHDCIVCGAISDERTLADDKRTDSFSICQGGVYPDWGYTIDMNSASEMEKVLEEYFAEKAAIDKIKVYPVGPGDGWRVEITAPSAAFTMHSERGEVVGLVVRLKDLAPSLW